MAKMLPPYYGSGEDADRIIQYLRTKPTGVAVSELAKTLGDAVVDARKLDFYDLLGFFSRNNNQFKLTPKGLDYLHGDQQRRHGLVRDALRQFPPYQLLLDWVFHNKVDVLDADRVRHEWATRFSDTVDLENSYRLIAAPLPFLAICQFAGLGTFIIGRRGSKSRIEFNRQALTEYLTSDLRSENKAETERENTVQEIGPAALPPIAGGANGTTTTTAVDMPGHVFVIPVFGKTAKLVWPEPTMSSREWEKIKKVGDAMFSEAGE